MKPEKQRALISKGKRKLSENAFQQRIWHLHCSIHTALPLEQKQTALGNDHAALAQQYVQGLEALMDRIRCLRAQTSPKGDLLL